MRLFEFADAKASLELWKLVNDCVWKAISVQAQEQERLEQEQALNQKKKPKSAPQKKQPPKPQIPRPQPSKAVKTSAQKIQSQKVQSKTLRSKPQTVLPSSNSVTSVGAQNTVKKRSQNRTPHNPNSVASIQRQIDPLAFDPIAKDMIN
jgi:outer membrane biosynthesis protein TonB